MTPPWGVLIDRVQGVIEVRRTQFHATPPILMGSTPSSFNSIVRRDGEVLMVLDPHSVNPFRRYSTTADLIAFPPDDHHLARLAAAMQVSSKLPGIAGDKPGSRGLVTFSLEQDLGDGRDVSIGFSISQVAEILESASIIPVPKAPEYIGGLFFWRDIAVPIVDILARMGLSGAPPAEAERYIIVRHPLTTNGKDPSPTGTPKRLVFAALGINTDVRILRSPIASRPSSRNLPFKPGLIRSQVELETGTLVIPDLQALLTPQTA
jgi:chemotaxis signal transduction protein